MSWTDPTTRATGYVVTSTDWNGVQNNFGLVDRVYYKKTTGKAVNSTTSATDLLNGEVTIAAGDMGTSGIVRLTCWGNWLQNSGAAHDIPNFQLFLGGTKLIDPGPSLSNLALNSANRYGWRIQCEIQNTGAANTQQAFMEGNLTYLPNALGSSTGWFTLGDGAVEFYDFTSLAGKFVWSGGAVSGNDFTAVDTTAACVLALKVVNGNNSANYETKLLGALVELL